jgi:hypothetical protein
MPRLRRATKRFKESAIASLILSIELFNRPSEEGRVDAVLMQLQHAFEMLLKAKIWQERGRITEPRSSVAYGFDKCLGIARSDLGIINEDEAATLSMLDGLRDCATHNQLILSEENFYVHVQSGVTMFNDLLQKSFGERLYDYLPQRVLPISTNPPRDIALFLNEEFNRIQA